MKRVLALGGFFVAALNVGAAHAVDELNVGVMAHNIKILNGKNANKESGPNIEAELVFDRPHFLRFLGAPRPYLMASINTQGNTSFAGGGLNWRFRFFDDRIRFQPGLGIIGHDGALDNKYPISDPRHLQYADENVFLGSRALFRTTLVSEYRFTDRLGVQVLYEHLSHGQILGHGRNQGLDEAGVRLSYKFHAR
jgi:lipid A 3-O-deacylase